MKAPRISIIMPVYNGERFLKEAIDSVLAQSFDDFELIIVNDGSIDSSEDIIKAYSDKRIVYLKNERNSGICITLNNGLSVAKGEYIARMDSDDISLPERLMAQVCYMDKHPDIAVLGSDVVLFGESLDEQLFANPHTPEMCRAGLLFNSPLAHPSVMIRKTVINKYNLRYKDEYRGREDFELWWQISKQAKITNIPKPLLRYRIHKQQVTQNITESQLQLARRFTDERMKDIGLVLSKEQLDLLNSYCLGRYDSFNETSIYVFVDLLSNIKEHFPARDRKEKYALKRTLTLSVLYIIGNAHLHSERKSIIKLMLDKGLTPFHMYLRQIIK